MLLIRSYVFCREEAGMMPHMTPDSVHWSCYTQFCKRNDHTSCYIWRRSSHQHSLENTRTNQFVRAKNCTVWFQKETANMFWCCVFNFQELILLWTNCCFALESYWKVHISSPVSISWTRLDLLPSNLFIIPERHSSLPLLCTSVRLWRNQRAKRFHTAKVIRVILFTVFTLFH